MWVGCLHVIHFKGVACNHCSKQNVFKISLLVLFFFKHPDFSYTICVFLWFIHLQWFCTFHLYVHYIHYSSLYLQDLSSSSSCCTTWDISDSTCCSRVSDWWARAKLLMDVHVDLNESRIFCLMSAPILARFSFNSE